MIRIPENEYGITPGIYKNDTPEAIEYFAKWLEEHPITEG